MSEQINRAIMAHIAGVKQRGLRARDEGMRRASALYEGELLGLRRFAEMSGADDIAKAAEEAEYAVWHQDFGPEEATPNA